MPEIELSSGTIHYQDEGTGPAVVFVHGLMVNHLLWRPVVERMRARARCIVPDLPLGAHPQAMSADAAMSPPGVARLIAELVERLELEDITLVGNDTGGALCQLTVVAHGERIGRLMLTNCDSFEHFPPPAFAPVARMMRVPGVAAEFQRLGRVRPLRRAVFSLMGVTANPIDDDILKAWLRPLRDRGVRRDLRRFLGAMEPSHTLAAAERLPEFDRPVVIAWGSEDVFFPFGDAERLAALFPQSRLERIEGARTFLPLDAPEKVAELIAELVPAPV